MTDDARRSLRDRLAAALVAGEWLDLLPDQPWGARIEEAIDEASFRVPAALVALTGLGLVLEEPLGAEVGEASTSAWGDEHDLAAEDLRSLMLGRALPAGS